MQRPTAKPNSPICKTARAPPPIMLRRLPPEVACLVLDRLDGADLLLCLDLGVFTNVDADDERRRRAERRSRGVKKRDLVRCGDVEALKHIHETRGARFFLQDVALAAAGGHLEVVKWVYEHAQEGHLYGAIEAAAAGGHLAVVDWLAQHGTGRVSPPEREVIFEAAKGGHLPVIEYACKGRSPSHRVMVQAAIKAARHGHTDVVRYLCNSGRSALTADGLDRMVDAAAERGHIAIVEFLWTTFGSSGTVRGLFGAVGGAHVCTAVRLYEIGPQRASLLQERRRVVGADAPSAALWKAYEARAGDGATLFHGPSSYQNYRMTQRDMGLFDVACASGSLDMVTALWERRAGVWTSSLLCCAVMGGNADILRHLLVYHGVLRAQTSHRLWLRDLTDAVGDAFVLGRPDLAVLAERLYALLPNDASHAIACDAPLAPVDDAALAGFYARALTNGLHQRGCILESAVVGGHFDLVADLQTRGFPITSVTSYRLIDYGSVDLLRSLTDDDLKQFDDYMSTHSLFGRHRTDMVRYIYVERGTPVPDVVTAADDDGDGDDNDDDGGGNGSDVDDSNPFWEQDSLIAGLVPDPSADADLVVGLLTRYEVQGDVRIVFRINHVLLAAVEHGRSDVVDAVATRFSCMGKEDLTIDRDFGSRGCDTVLLERVCNMYGYVAWYRSRLWVHAARRNNRAAIEWLCDHNRLTGHQCTEAIELAAEAGHRRLVEWMWERGFRPSDRYARVPLCKRENDRHLFIDHHAAECFLFGRTG